MAPYKPAFRSRLDALESVPFDEADLQLPEEPGCYIVTTKQKIPLYVGQSMNMRRRWAGGHHQTFPCLRAGAKFIYYYVNNDPIETEKEYIEFFKPYLNER